jgi:hypothetical protein
MRVSFNFMICRAFHESRTIPLWETTCSMIARDYRESSVSLLGGFAAFDHIPVEQVTDRDDYQSCHDKLYSVFDRNNGNEADWLIVADDDTWLHLPNLANLLGGLPGDRPLIAGLVCDARVPDGPDIAHAHGGAGILINAAAFQVLKASPVARPIHPAHSDVSLAMWVRDQNATGVAAIQWAFIHEMHGPEYPLEFIDFRSAISVHVKDRALFPALYGSAGLA